MTRYATFRLTSEAFNLGKCRTDPIFHYGKSRIVTVGIRAQGWARATSTNGDGCYREEVDGKGNGDAPVAK